MEDLDQGYDDELFPGVVDEDLYCPICLNVLKDPMQCQINEHHFCTPCIKRHLTNFRTCPSCMEELSLKTLRKPSRFLVKTLAKLFIRCEYVNHGCEEVVHLENLESHVAICEYKPFSSQDDGVRSKRQNDHKGKEVSQFRIARVKASDYEAMRRKRDKLRIRLHQINFQMLRMKSEVRGLNADGIKDDIIIAGGINEFSRLNSVEILNCSIRRWRKLRPMRESRSALSSVSYKDKILVIGGYNGQTDFNGMETMNINQGPPEWLKFPAKLTKKCSTHRAVVYKDSLFVLGGYDGCSILDGIQKVHLKAPYSSRTISRMSQKRRDHGAVLIENKIFIVGGTTSGHYKDSTDSVEVYDITKNKCKKMPPLQCAVSAMATVSWRDNAVMIGGLDKNGQHLDSVIMYNTKGESTMLPPMKYKREGCTAVTSGNVIIVMGGWNKEEGNLNSVECFSFDSYSWENLPDLIEARRFATAVVKSAS